MTTLRKYLILPTLFSLIFHPVLAAAQGELQKSAAAAARYEMGQSLARLTQPLSYGEIVAMLQKQATTAAEKKFFKKVLKDNHLSPVEKVTPMRVAASGDGWEVKGSRAGTTPVYIELRGAGPVRLVVNGTQLTYAPDAPEKFFRELEDAAAKPLNAGFHLFPQAYANPGAGAALLLLIVMGIKGGMMAYDWAAEKFRAKEVAEHYRDALGDCLEAGKVAHLDFDKSATGKLYQQLRAAGLSSKALDAADADCEVGARKAANAAKSAEVMGDIAQACAAVQNFLVCAEKLHSVTSRAKLTPASVNSGDSSMEH